MKKVIILCIVALLSFSAVNAQKRIPGLIQDLKQNSRVLNTPQTHNMGAKITGNPAWQDTMSYCLDAAFSSSVGVNDQITMVYWAIKIESAALVGRNNITDIQFYVYAAGSYTASIAYGSTGPGTAVFTQAVTATSSDENTWKNIHLTTPLSITQNQDMWIILQNADVNYPATGVTGNVYDNGKYISLDGSTWNLVTDYSLDYTWMIRAISDTYTVQPPIVSISGPTDVLAGVTATYTANSTNSDSYVWYTPGADNATTNDNVAQVTWNTPGAKQVIVAATNTVGTTYDTLDVNVIDCSTITDLPWTEGFEGVTSCWQLIDNDDDANNWVIDELSSYAHGGTHVLYNRYSSTQEDNWAISPAIAIPSNASDINLSWWANIRSAAYPETYEVLISTTGSSSLSSFTMVFSDTDSVATYKKRMVSLAAYAGQTINVAFRYRSTDQFYLYIDDIRIGGAELPEGVAISGPTEASVNTNVTFTASSITTDVTFAWTFEGGTPASATGETVSTSWSTAGNHNVILAASNAVGTVYDTLSVEVFECTTVTDLPYTVNFNQMSSLRCWNAIDANSDGFTWSIMPNYGAVNYSYDNESEEAIEPDDYLVSPAITLPANGNYELYFKLYAGDNDYPAEHYSVYVSTGNTASDFTTAAFTETLSSSNYVEHILNLSSYAGQTVHIAFRHHDCEDMYVLVLEQVEVRGMSTPSVAISAPAKAIAGNTVTITAVGDNIDSYSWNIQGGTPSTATTQSVDVVWNNPGTYTISVTATNAAGSTTETATINVISCDPITSFPFTEDFEGSNFDCWTTIDADGDGYGWDLPATYSDPYGHNNSYSFLSSNSYINGLGALNPDNWVFTPAMQIPADGDFVLAWFERGMDEDYADEYYAVYVTTSPSVTQADPIYQGYATGEWIRNIISLSEYAGQTVYIGFRHYNVTDMFVLQIDDIFVGSSDDLVGIRGTEETAVNLYPNPTTGNITVDGEGIRSIEVLDLNGRTVKRTNQAGLVDLSDVANGVYMVRIITDNGFTLKKVVKR